MKFTNSIRISGMTNWDVKQLRKTINQIVMMERDREDSLMADRIKNGYITKYASR